MKILLQIKKYIAMAQKLFKEAEPIVAPIVEAAKEQSKPVKKKSTKPKAKKNAVK